MSASAITENTSLVYTPTNIEKTEGVPSKSKLNQAIIEDLAFRSFQIPQKTKEMIDALYAKNAMIVLRPDSSPIGTQEFVEWMTKSNPLNVLEIAPNWSNTYADPNRDGSIIVWTAEGCQRRRGIAPGEEGEGWYKIKQVAHFTFANEDGKTKILSQNNAEYVKVKVKAPS